MRNAIRYAVEVCSVSRMKAAMDARNSLVHIYGPDLCSEEVAAVMNMMRMLSLAPTSVTVKDDVDNKETGVDMAKGMERHDDDDDDDDNVRNWHDVVYGVLANNYTPIICRWEHHIVCPIPCCLLSCGSNWIFCGLPPLKQVLVFRW